MDLGLWRYESGSPRHAGAPRTVVIVVETDSEAVGPPMAGLDVPLGEVSMDGAVRAARERYEAGAVRRR